MSAKDTIAAISTPPGSSGIGVVRVSGPGVPNLIQKLFKQKLKPREATLKKINDSKGNIIDHAISIYYQKPKSYTGEEMLEIHAHGNPIILETILKNIMENNVRPARPGEFTEKAFLNNKIDLAQAEAVSDLISSRNLSAIKGACNSMGGVFSIKVRNTEDELLDTRSIIEASINFPEDDVPTKTLSLLKGKLENLDEQLRSIIVTADEGIKLCEEATYCVVGQPNAGKSSLVNLLLGDNASIVSNTPGTTRDSIQYETKISGSLLTIIDTAGLREPKEKVEEEGINRTRQAISKANRVLYLVDDQIGFSEKDQKIIEDFGIKKYDIVFNKIDITHKKPSIEKGPIHKIYVSVKEEKGIEYIKKLLNKQSSKASSSENTVTARTRHLEAAKNALELLYNARKHLDNDELEIVAEELKAAHDQLSLITGGNNSEELLARIFSEFCIGK